MITQWAVNKSKFSELYINKTWLKKIQAEQRDNDDFDILSLSVKCFGDQKNTYRRPNEYYACLRLIWVLILGCLS